MRPTKHTYRAREFATLAGVTVRALHHYDRIGLLTPRRTASGYRVYSATDLETLEQIVVLKFIGLPLQTISGLRSANADRLARSLSAQRGVLERKRQLLDQAISAIQELEANVSAKGDAAPALFKRIIEVIEMQNNSDAWKREYDQLVQAKIERVRSMSPDAAHDLRAQWNVLVADIRSALRDDPASARAQECGTRWMTLLSQLMGQPVSATALSTHQSAQEWNPQMASFVDKPVWDFMTRVLAARS